MSNLLSIKNLTIQFKTKQGLFTAVDDISFDLGRNRILGLVGESGSGKSVTAMSICQLLPKHQSIISKNSSIEFNGVDLINIQPSAMKKIRGNEICMIFQEPMTSLNPFHRIGDQITEAILIHQKISKKEAKNESLRLLELVEIPSPREKYFSYPFELSGGQRQRVMIAMALANKPQLLIADEPTTALDVTIQAQILDLMSRLKDEVDASILFITHDLGLVRKFSDQLVVMKQGKVVEQGFTQDIFNTPKHPYTIKLIQSEPSPKKNSGLMTRPLLEVSNLTVKYNVPTKSLFTRDTFTAVNNVSFCLDARKTIGIVGESGSGKSTLGKAIVNLLPYQGNILYDGLNIGSMAPNKLKKLRKDIQIIFQDPFGSLSPRMTVGEIIKEGAKLHFHNTKSENNDLVDHVMEKVSLNPNDKNKYPHEFSGGQRQRIAIARSIILKPKLLVLDEPTSALDRSIQIQVLELLKDLQSELGLSYIFISHDLRVIRSISDKIVVMKNGKIVEAGNANDVFDFPKEKYTQELMHAAVRYSTI
ncbi:MAG: ABC transporter ATP-binding protein [Gammaproteobacteria bacterium]